MPRKSFYPTTNMIADKPFRYGTRRLLAGDTFDARTKDIVILKALKRAHPVRDKNDIPEIPESLKRKVAAPVPSLYGSSILQPTYEIGGQTVQLGTIVANAHKDSGLSVEAWNMLPTGEREDRLAAELKRLQDSAATDADEDEDEDEDEEEQEEQEEEVEKTETKTPEELLADARARYKEIVGRAAYAGWDVDKIEENIAVFQAKK